MMQLVLSCEHASNHVPARFAALFRGAEAALASHRGWDPGSLEMGEIFQQRFAVPLHVTTATRLLVEPNRSLGHRRLFSQYTESLDEATKQAILAEYYFPHRNAVESTIGQHLASGHTVLHVSLHTFVPELDGEKRNADVGLLYDPRRTGEQTLCLKWHRAIRATRDELRVRRNYPYLGKADGLTTHLRRRFPADRYLGIELEANQGWVNDPQAWKRLSVKLADSLQIAIDT